jgi:hypothetical protein
MGSVALHHTDLADPASTLRAEQTVYGSLDLSPAKPSDREISPPPGGDDLMRELARAIAREYGWPYMWVRE